MRNFAVSCIVLALAALAPVSGEGGRFDAAWGLGMLMVLAYAGQQAARWLRLPPLVGWVAAGIVLGAGGIEAVLPTHVAELHLVHLFAAIWVGFHVGLGLAVPPARRSWRLVGALAVSTTLAFALTSAGIAVAFEQPWSLAALIGGLGCLWGPFALSALRQHEDETQFVSVVGSAVGMVLLCTLMVMLQRRGVLPYATVWTVSSVLISLVAGGFTAEILWQLRVFARRSATIAGLVGVFLLAAAVLDQQQLFTLPFGLACGFVIRWRTGPSDMLRHLLEPSRPLAAMVFFALLGASLDVVGLALSPHPLLVPILLLQVVVLVLLRGLVPAVWYMRPSAVGRTLKSYTTWHLLPRGALLFELVFWPRGGLLALLPEPTARLVSQFVTADVIIYAVGFSAVAAGVAGLSSPPTEDTATEAVAEAEPRSATSPESADTDAT